jgi:hypothetical protein
MRKLTFILLALLPVFGHAQMVNSFSNGILKPAKESQNNLEFSVTDLSPQNEQLAKNSLLDIPRQNPLAAFAASAIIPGSGQAINGKWGRAGVYFAAEVLGIIYHLDRQETARRQEEAYESYTHENWSVVAYSQWLVRYSDANNLSQTGLERLRSEVFDANGNPISPSWGSTRNDWSEVSLSILRQVEDETPFIFENRTASTFSHNLPNYGSQQYYELISKYYQFQSGWRDFYSANVFNENHSFTYTWNGLDEPYNMLYEGTERAEEFNENYRIAGNMLKLLVLNHVVSAFDAFFTVQLKNSRIETETNLMSFQQFSVTWHF